MIRKPLVLGVAPTRRDWFSNEVVLANRDAVNKAAQQICERYGARFVGIEGLSEDGTMSTLEITDRVIDRFRQQGVNALFVPHCNFGQ